MKKKSTRKQSHKSDNSKAKSTKDVDLPQTECSESQQWVEFQKRWSDHPFLDVSSVFALPAELILEIQDKSNLFSGEELEFEQDLAGLGGGFFQQHPFGYLGLSRRPQSAEDEQHAAKVNEATTSIRSMLAIEYASRGLSNMQIEKVLAENVEWEVKVAERREGFAGWLLTNPEFAAQRTQLFEQWPEAQTTKSQYLRFPRSFLGETSEIPRKDREIFSDIVLFLQRWNLEALSAGELPVPMHPGWHQPGFYSEPHLGQAGLQVFLPWYLLRHRDFDLNELVRAKQLVEAPSHLSGWIENEDTKWGPKRYALMLRLYVWIELALKRRYGLRLKGLTTRVDHAIASYLETGGDIYDTRFETVKKVRQRMNRRLKGL